MLAKFTDVESETAAERYDFLVGGILKKHRDLPPRVFRDLPEIRRIEMVGMLVTKPDMRDRPEIIVRELCRRDQPPAIVKRAAFDPRIGQKPDVTRFDDDASMIDECDRYHSRCT